MRKYAHKCSSPLFALQRALESDVRHRSDRFQQSACHRCARRRERRPIDIAGRALQSGFRPRYIPDPERRRLPQILCRTGSGRLHTQPIACSPRRSPRTSPCSLGTASKAAFCSGQWHARSDDARVHVPRGGARRSTCVAPDPWKHLNAVRRHRCGSRTEAPETWAPNGQQRTDRNDRLWMQCLRMNQKQ